VQILIFGGKNIDNVNTDNNVFFNIFETGQTTVYELDSNTGFRMPVKWPLLGQSVLDERVIRENFIGRILLGVVIYL
jgi:hypothetical protein